MLLTNTQLNDLTKRMKVPLEAVVFKSELKDMKLKRNVGYICNLEDQYDSDGKLNDGSHLYMFSKQQKCQWKSREYLL